MTRPWSRPLLFLDVDGTFLPYGGTPLPLAADDWQRWQHASDRSRPGSFPDTGPGCRPAL